MTDGLWPALWMRGLSREIDALERWHASEYRPEMSVVVDGEWLHEDDMTPEQRCRYLPEWKR